MHIYLRSKINVILAKGNTIVALRKKPEAMTCTVTKCEEIS